MFWQRAMRYPVLAIGILFFTIYITSPQTKKFWEEHFGKMKPSTCRVVKERFEQKSEKDWDLACPAIKILQISFKSSISKESSTYREQLYRELANSISYLGQISNPETLGYLKQIHFNIDHAKVKILAKTDGAAVVQMAQTKDKKALLELLKLTVKVKEIRE